MTRKIIPLLILLIISVSCLSFVSADNNTTVTEEIEDLTNYITVSSINGDKIEFSDGFIGFCLDSAKKISADSKFTSKSTTNNENAVKLAIIECYKQNKVNEMGSIISKVVSKDTSDPIAQKVLSSGETIGDSALVEINNITEGNFNFELLKSSNDGSDCIAYKVSLQTIIPEDTLAAGENSTDGEAVNESGDTSKDTTPQGQNNSEEETTPTQNNETKDVKTADDENNGETTVNEKNKTIINKTKTVIVNETNTTIINQNNTKIINKTNETPQNATVQDTIMKAAGNPIFILVVVIVVIAVVAVVMRKR